MAKKLVRRLWVIKNAKRDATIDRSAISTNESPQTAYVKAIVYGYQQDSQKVLHKKEGRIKRKYMAARDTLDKLNKKQEYLTNLPEATALEDAMEYYKIIKRKKEDTEDKLSQIGERRTSGESFFELKAILENVSAEIAKMERPASSKESSTMCLEQLRLNKSAAETKCEKELSKIEKKAKSRIKSFEKIKQSCIKKINKKAEDAANLLSLYWRKYRAFQQKVNVIISFQSACQKNGVVIININNVFTDETNNLNDLRRACNLYNAIKGKPII